MANEFVVRNGLIVLGDTSVSGQFISSVSGNTTPMVINSSTEVSNLNVEYLQGYHASDFSTSGHTHSYYVTTGTTINGYTLSGTGLTLTTNDIPDSLNKRYVSDNELSGITHSNRNVIDLLSDSGNTLFYNGVQVGTVQIQSDWNQSNSGSTDFIKNKPLVYTTGQTDTLLNNKVDKITNYSLVADSEIAKIHSQNTDSVLLSPDKLNTVVYTDNANNLYVTGNIYQSGQTYVTHVNDITTTGDTITLRYGAISGLGIGQYTGFIAKLYDGVNDGSLVFDKDGWARVGNVGQEQKIATIEETPTNNYLMKWNSSTLRLEGIDSLSLPISTLVQTELNGKVNTGITVNGQTLNGNVSITPSNLGVYTSGQTDTLLNNKVDKNNTITGGTFTKITFDNKGLVTSGSNATTSDISDTLDKRYVTDIQRSGITHTNRTVLDLLSDSGSTLFYNGVQVGTVQIQSDWGQSNSGSTDYIKNKPLVYTTGQTDTLLNNKVDKNVGITGGTYTKITFDSKGLVTSGQTATTNDIPDSLNKRYVTDLLYSGITHTNRTVLDLLSDSGSTLFYNGVQVGTVQIQSDWTQSNSSSNDYIKNKPIVYTQTEVNNLLALRVSTGTTINGYNLSGTGLTLTTNDISEYSNKRYVTDANLTVINNTSNVNSGDEVWVDVIPPPTGSTYDIWIDISSSGNTIVQETGTSTTYIMSQYAVTNYLNTKVSTGTTVNGQSLSGNVVITSLSLGVYTSGQTDSLLANKVDLVNRNMLSNSQSIISVTGSTISPDFDGVTNNSDLYKCESNYTGGTTVSVSSYVNFPTFDILKNVIIKNTKGSDITFAFATSDQISGGITYSFVFMAGSSASSILVPTLKTIDIIYTFKFTSSTTCTVSIIYTVEK